jgi:3-hydroxyisobutyrate dehydrogenase-like beta-hydroxyacid dehydrogenase
MKQQSNPPTEVTVIGLGQMGSTLAKILLQRGYRVTVWNRTISKGNALVKDGANAANDISLAIEASSVIVICVHDYATSKLILDKEEVTSRLSGRTLIQLTTGSPTDASESEIWAKTHGAGYLDGAIQVAPEQMARPDTTIFLSGNEDAYYRSEAILRAFGGNLKYLGNKITAASAMDLASLSYLYGSMLGFFHAVRICEVEGFSVALLGEIIREVSPGFSEFIQYEAGVIQSGNFAVTQSPLSISIEATDRILKASQEYNLNTDVPKLAAEFLKKAEKAGLRNEELASLIKVFREEPVA